jgi:probable phosphoglycerate mutase
MKLYFIRHGESEANTRHVISNRDSPFGLTPLGKQQAKTLAEKLREVPFTALFSSPVRRARETTEVLSGSFRIPYQVSEALREYDCGILEEKSDEESWKLHRAIADDWTLHHNYQRRPEGGECFLDIRNRFLPFVERLTSDGSPWGGHVLLVGHGGLFHLMLPLILTNIADSFVRSHSLGHTDVVLAEQRPDGLTCLQWGSAKFDLSDSQLS